jgi:uncharacterized protein with PIN domain
MIVVDSSALIAVLFEEPEKQAFQIIDGLRPRRCCRCTSHGGW